MLLVHPAPKRLVPNQHLSYENNPTLHYQILGWYAYFFLWASTLSFSSSCFFFKNSTNWCMVFPSGWSLDEGLVYYFGSRNFSGASIQCSASVYINDIVRMTYLYFFYLLTVPTSIYKHISYDQLTSYEPCEYSRSEYWILSWVELSQEILNPMSYQWFKFFLGAWRVCQACPSEWLHLWCRLEELEDEFHELVQPECLSIHKEARFKPINCHAFDIRQCVSYFRCIICKSFCPIMEIQ